MKKMYLFSAACCICLFSRAQRTGINTTSPEATLHVAGNLTSDVFRLERSLLPRMSFYENVTEVGSLVATGTYLSLYAPGYIGLNPGSNFNTAFTSNGNVGIGIQTPLAPLHIYRDADVWHSFIGGAIGRLQISGQTGNGAVLQSYNPATNVVRDLYL